MARDIDHIIDDDRLFPVLRGQHRALAETELDAMNDALSAAPSGTVAKTLAPLDFMPRRNTSDASTRMMIEVYELALGDLPKSVLSNAVAEHLRVSKFFPMPAEIRAHADRELGRMFAQRNRLAMWLRKRDRPQVDYATPDQVAAIKADIADKAKKVADAYAVDCATGGRQWRLSE